MKTTEEQTGVADIASIDWLAGDVITMEGVSFTTGERMTHTFTEEKWAKLWTHYPAWNFDHSTKRAGTKSALESGYQV